MGGRDSRKKWQNEWEVGTTVRQAFEVIKKVSLVGWKVSWKGSQLISGHRKFRDYLRRFARVQGPTECECGEGESGARHLWLECKKRTVVENIQVLREGLGGEGIDCPPRLGERNNTARVVALINDLRKGWWIVRIRGDKGRGSHQQKKLLMGLEGGQRVLCECFERACSARTG